MMVSERFTEQIKSYLPNCSQQLIIFNYQLQSIQGTRIKGAKLKCCNPPLNHFNLLNVYNYFLKLQIQLKIQMDDDISKEELYNKVESILHRNNQSQLFHKAFLKPIQVALKTVWNTQSERAYDSLPFGLKQAIKEDISLNKFKLVEFMSYEELAEANKKNSQDYQFLSNSNFDNLVSLLKRRDQIENSLELAICVCMYSEDKTMLRRTLSGISDNIANFVKNGVNPDKIGVFFIMDGIEVVDQTVVHFFQEMQKQSKIFLDQTVEAATEIDLIRTNVDEMQVQQVKNINEFVFNGHELHDRKRRRFYERKFEYERIKKMLRRIGQLQMQKKTTYETLDDEIKPYFIEKARQKYKEDKDLDDIQMRSVQKQQIEEEYGFKLSKCTPLIHAALNEAKKFCEQYIYTRDDLALLNTFRPEIQIKNQKKKKGSNIKQYDQSQPFTDEQEEEEKEIIRMNLFMVTKYKNSGKLSSHNWFFNGFCKELSPKYAVLLDVGLCPEPDALVKMYNYMVNSDDVGGVCGYMGLRIQRLQDGDQVNPQNIDWLTSMTLKVVDIQRAQQLQYHFAHLVDKPFESIFNFIHVLPGAFSAYRMKALQPVDYEDSQLLKEYFKSLDKSTSSQLLAKSEFSMCHAIWKSTLPDFAYECFYGSPKQNSQESLLYDSNVYLAEDRTLCMGIHQNNYQLQYLPDAYAWVDPIKNLHGLLGQRKRWINGSFFAFDKVKSTIEAMSAGQCCLRLQILFLTVMNMLAYIAPSLFFFTIHIAMFAFRSQVLAQLQLLGPTFYDAFVYTVDFIYIANFMGLIFFSMHLTSRNTKFMPYIYIASTVFGLFSLIIFIVLTYDLIDGLIQIIDNGGQNAQFLTDNSLSEEFKQTDQFKTVTMLLPSLYYIILGTFLLYIIPVGLYPLIYQRFSFVQDILFSTVSFIFYGPTYLNILSVYALCRIDDISWGTKGLDTQANKRASGVQNTWKKIKFMYVFKFVFWNILISCVLLSVGGGMGEDSYAPRFFLTYAIMCILAFTLFLKILLGTIYMVSYRCSKKQYPNPNKKKGMIQDEKSVNKYFSKVKGSMYRELREYIDNIGEDAKEKNVPLKSIMLRKTKLDHIVNRGRQSLQAKKKFKNQSRINKFAKKKGSPNEKQQNVTEKKQETNIKKKEKTSFLQSIPENHQESVHSQNRLIIPEQQPKQKKKGSFKRDKSLFDK